MQSSDQLQTLLHSVNRKSYPAYKSLRGAYQFDRYILSIDHRSEERRVGKECRSRWSPYH